MQWRHLKFGGIEVCLCILYFQCFSHITYYGNIYEIGPIGSTEVTAGPFRAEDPGDTINPDLGSSFQFPDPFDFASQEPITFGF